MDKIVDPELYDKNYYLTSDLGFKEFLAGLEGAEVHYKFSRVLRHCDLTQGKYALDIGCGRGEMVYYAAKAGARALGIDYSAAAIELANAFRSSLSEDMQSRMEFLCADAGSVCVRDGFDYVFMVEVWEHMYDYQIVELLKKIYGILKKGGVLIITTPNGFYERRLYPLKRILNIPFNLIKFPLRILRGKWRPDSIQDLLRHIFKVRPFSNTFMDQTHVNISSLWKINKILVSCGFLIKDTSLNSSRDLVSRWFARWCDRELVIKVVKKAGKTE